jgi:hypothetical protein
MKTLHSGNWLKLGAIALIVLGAFSCSKDNDHTPQVAGLMAFNLASDQPLVAIALSGNRLATPLPYTNYTGTYLAIYPGTRSVTSFDANAGSTLATDSATFTSGKYYSVFVTGRNGNYRDIIIADGLDTLRGTAGLSYIRYVNAITDSAHPAVMIGIGDSAIVNQPAAYGEVSPFRAVPAGDVLISVSDAGGISSSRTITTAAQKIYTVLLLGNPASGQTGADSVQIRYVENGALTEDTSEMSAEKVD